MIVCFDTGPLIAAVQRQTPGGGAPSPEEARRLVAYYAGEQAQLVIPAPVLTEFFWGTMSPHDRAAAEEHILKHFVVAAFDQRAALIASRFSVSRKQTASIRQESGKTANTIKLDVLVLATAIAAQAEVLVTGDKTDFLTLWRNTGRNIEQLPLTIQTIREALPESLRQTDFMA